MFVSVSLINIWGYLTLLYLTLQTFNHVLLLFYRDHVPQLFFFKFCIDYIFGPSMDMFKAEELVPVFQKKCHNSYLWIIEWDEPQTFTRSSAIFLRSKLVIERYLPTFSCMYSRLLNRICRWKRLCLAKTILILVSNVMSSSSKMKSICRCFVCGIDIWNED